MPKKGVYVQFDNLFTQRARPFWFKCLFRNAQDMKASSQAGKLFHVDLVGQKAMWSEPLRYWQRTGMRQVDFAALPRKP